MAIAKGRSDGGQGGKRGHSNMDHWDFTEDIKLAAKKSRRLEAKNDVKEGVGEYHDDATTQSSEESEK
ncbi:MAG: hypothetical protein QOH70_277 [Blastocatellia bacterium]|jgi:hypothetical protein|nr:hypothetical protein [Blastocatellia bacterium]